MTKRILSFFLTLTLLLCALPTTRGQAANRRKYITDRSAVDGSYYTPAPALAEKLNKIRKEVKNNKYAMDAIDFIENRSKRGIRTAKDKH